MRVQLTKEYEGQPAGLMADWPDDRAKAAVDAGAAVEAARVRMLRDETVGGRLLPARFEFDLVRPDAAKAVADGAAEYADPKEAERLKGGGGGEAEAKPARAHRTPKAE